MLKSLVNLAAAAGLLAAAPAALAAQAAHADLKSATGATIGAATFTEGLKGVLVRIESKGLPPGWHGVHFHETGDCSKAGFTSAGGHVHTAPSHMHGLLNPAGDEAGDLPNLFVGADGVGAAEFFTTWVSLGGADGRPKLLDADGAALVVHAKPDDHSTQPIGGAGARIACGVIQ